MANDEWYTPVELMQDVATFWRPINWIDCTTCDAAIQTTPDKHRPTRYVTKEDDFFKQEWAWFITTTAGWLNPPYSKESGGAGVFIDHLRTIPFFETLILVNAATATKWWQRCAKESTAVCHISPRLRYDKVVDGVRVAGTSPRYSNTLFYTGPRLEVFKDVFGHWGATHNIS